MGNYNMIKELRDFKKKDRKLKELKEDRNKLLSKVQESTNIRLKGMRKKIQDSKSGLNKERETLKKIQTAVEMELKRPIIQLENPRGKSYHQNKSIRRLIIRD